MSRDPLFGFHGASLKGYIERNPLQVGQQLLIYRGSAMTHEYQLVKVVEPESGKQKRVVVQPLTGGDTLTFYRTGSNVSKKLAEFKLLPLVPWVISRLGQALSVRFDWRWRYA